ncbi:MAG: hypothetical protein KatS3mg032_0640 [Cyclobacteriaceae bacterium]|nr:MAG: hypothetical protein KatS3mg032_0640 [Cyclobacteriaceae bacterium]
MAHATPEIIEVLRATAQALETTTDYQWGHMGACNCGFLAQQVTKAKKEDIHSRAMLRQGDWTEQLNDYCPQSGLPMDGLIDDLLGFGFSLSDLKHLERLTDATILDALPGGRRYLKHNVKEDVILYLRTWALLLEEQFTRHITLPLSQGQVNVPV